MPCTVLGLKRLHGATLFLATECATDRQTGAEWTHSAEEEEEKEKAFISHAFEMDVCLSVRMSPPAPQVFG